MKKRTIKRLAAFLVDYLVIAGYAGILFLIATLLKMPELGPVSGQVTGFVTLTIPVFLYFFLAERGAKSATFGKRIFKLEVISRPGWNRIRIRIIDNTVRGGGMFGISVAVIAQLKVFMP